LADPRRRGGPHRRRGQRVAVPRPADQLAGQMRFHPGSVTRQMRFHPCSCGVNA
jgi:hypothetical protein